ncbi:hypothetical protein QJS04_geneDACA002037 [Acorus gramineus]|uniref:Uncharacterized protein n=1 Tax=Acorus gramineus TaxID=55184 RepID=A0AAV9A8B2_ACOGR|nr:hypothetical protein QJS04_geneDACA002037 [Acorus gramineus]
MAQGQQWEFRMRDSHIESSSDDSDESQTSSSSEPIHKKHKFISDFETSDTGKSPAISYSQPREGQKFKTNKIRVVSKSSNTGMKERPLHNGEENSKSVSHKTVSIESIRMYMESILEELKVARDKLFMRMREEMWKLLDDPTLEDSEFMSEFQERSGGIPWSAKRKRTLVVHSGTQATLPTEPERREVRDSNEVPSSSNNPNRAGPPKKITFIIPSTVVSEASTENQRFNYHSFSSSATEMNESHAPGGMIKTNAVFDMNIHNRNSVDSPQEGKFRTLNQINSQDLSYANQREEHGKFDF